jgi:predicted nucleic acid-binding protein
MFWIKEISQALRYKHLKKRKLHDHYALLVSQILQILITARLYPFKIKTFFHIKHHLSQQWTPDGYEFVP